MQMGNQGRNGRSAAEANDAEGNETVNVESEEEWEGFSASEEAVYGLVAATEVVSFQGHSRNILPSSTLMGLCLLSMT